jgi:hypothetical protein
MHIGRCGFRTNFSVTCPSPTFERLGLIVSCSLCLLLVWFSSILVDCLYTLQCARHLLSAPTVRRLAQIICRPSHTTLRLITTTSSWCEALPHDHRPCLSLVIPTSISFCTIHIKMIAGHYTNTSLCALGYFAISTMVQLSHVWSLHLAAIWRPK